MGKNIFGYDYTPTQSFNFVKTATIIITFSTGQAANINEFLDEINADAGGINKTAELAVTNLSWQYAQPLQQIPIIGTGDKILKESIASGQLSFSRLCSTTSMIGALPAKIFSDGATGVTISISEVGKRFTNCSVIALAGNIPANEGLINEQITIFFANCEQI